MEIDQIFNRIFGADPSATGFAPGRVNLIGEHIDYNGGHVLPCALSMGISCAARLRDDCQIRLYSENFPSDGIIEASLKRLENRSRWSDYICAVFSALLSRGYVIDCGVDMAFCGDLPDGAGLSSSAAIEVLTATMLKALFRLDITAPQIALAAQLAENRFIGLNCGIMDQFVSAMGRVDCAVLLNTETLSYTYVPLPSEKVSVVMINSGVKHSLASSAYNDRRRECEMALTRLNHVLKAPALCAATPEQWEKYGTAVTDPICYRRARHAVYENARTLSAVKALENGDPETFGKLMVQSHISLRDDYEVSCPELDMLVEKALTIDGVYGARMTGGGFGGCTVNLVKKDKTEGFVAMMTEFYETAFGRPAPIYVASVGGGARCEIIC